MNHSQKRKLLVIGVDQAIPSLIDKFVEEGALPNISKLIKNGVYTQGLSCPPCDTPTNWATIATGAPTEIHGATSFYMHIPGESLDEGLDHRSRTQLSRYAGAEYFWEAADRQQLKSFIINYPAGWPAKLKQGIMSLYTWPVPESLPRTIKPNQIIEISLQLEGNQSKGIFPNPFLLEIVLSANNSLQYSNENLFSPNTLIIEEWSDWITQTFSYKDEEIACIYRFKVLEISEDRSSIKVEHSAIYNTQGWTTPDDFANQIIKAVPFFDRPEIPEVEYMIEGDVAPFLKYARQEVTNLAKIIAFAQNEMNWDICFFHVHHLDSVNHKMLAEMIPAFPKYDEQKAKIAESNVRVAYQIIDEMIGQLLDSVIDDNMIVCFLADHGAIPAWKNINIPKAFIDAGLMDYSWDEQTKRYHINWRKTQAFPYLEPPYIWVNLKGRDPDGIVEEENYELIRDQIITTLENLKDPATGKKIVKLVARKEDLFDFGQKGERVGDVVFFFNPPYQSFDGKLADLNTAIRSKKDMNKDYTYSAKHCFGAHAYYLPDTSFQGYTVQVPIILTGPGIKKGIKITEPCKLIDIAPTLAYLLGIDPPKDATGKIQTSFFNVT